MSQPITPAEVRSRANKALITLEDLFKRADIAPSTFWRWERETHKPRPLTIEKLKQALEKVERERK
jgi:predicted transcriptional regulator